MARNIIKAVAPADPASPDSSSTFDSLEAAFRDARSSFWSAKSVADLIIRHDIAEDAGEAIHAIARPLRRNGIRRFERPRGMRHSS